MVEPPSGGFKMPTNQKRLPLFRKRWERYSLIPLVVIGLAGILPFFEPKTPAAEADFEASSNENLEVPSLAAVQENALLPIPNPLEKQGNPIVVEQIEVIVTAYSSTVWETDNHPYLTAAGTQVRDGVVANNLLPFGTQIRLPEIYGNKIFVVEDRMNSRKGKYQIDIWFPSFWEAKNFGAKTTIMEIVEEYF
jgi:3D (Asp-Asp-Asp) domain-containing protein